MDVELLRPCEVRSCWSALTRSAVASPFHDPYAIEGVLACMNPAVVRAAAIGAEWLSVFDVSRETGVARCVFEGHPFLGASGPRPAEMDEYLARASAILGAVLYFPLVYADSPGGDALSRSAAARWDRLPSPTVSGASLREGLVARARERLGSRADRRLRRFALAGITVHTFGGDEAMRWILSVEGRSWKRSVGQDLRTRGQTELYATLARSPASRIRVALAGQSPVAYRFDYLAGDVVYSLKWSYSEEWRGVSPGFTLLVRDLADCWASTGVRIIDLHGSPDTLKAAVCDPGGERVRTDFGWPPEQSCINQLRRERLAHDQKLRARFDAGGTLKGIYTVHRGAEDSNHPCA